jgi:hypothetical protein
MKYFLFIALSVQLLEIKGQQIDRDFFLIGTLDDYIGRADNRSHPKQWGQVIIIHQNFIGQIKRIEEVASKKFKKLKSRVDCRNCHEFFYLKSIRLSRKINSYYTFDKKVSSLYRGTLNCQKIATATKIQKLSFVSGLFLTTGEKSGQYRISIYNSRERFECLKKILKDLNTDILDEKITEGIPWSYVIDFAPDLTLKKYLEVELSKKILDKKE